MKAKHGLKYLRHLLIGSFFLGGCHGTSPSLGPLKNTYQPLVDENESVQGRTAFRLERGHVSLSAGTLEPKSEAITLKESQGSAIRATALVKRLPARPNIILVEVQFENLLDRGLKSISVDVAGVPALDMTNDPFAEQPLAHPIMLGGIGPRGIGVLRLGMPAGQGNLDFELRWGGETTRFVSSSSAPLAFDSVRNEVWAPYQDGNVIAIIDADQQRRIAQLTAGKGPRGVALSPDGQLALIVSSDSNEVHVFERQSKRLVQVIGEADGLNREPRYIVMSPDGSRAFVSTYVSGTVDILKRTGQGFILQGSVKVGPKPMGLSVGPDNRTVFVAHHMPRGKVRDNEGWVSIVDAEDGRKLREVVIRDYFNLAESECLAQAYSRFGATPADLTTEGVPTQLNHVLLNPGGSEAWIPGTRVPGLPVYELGQNHSPISGTYFDAKGEFTAVFNFILDNHNSAQPQLGVSHGVLDMDDVDFSHIRCGKYTFEMELTERRILPEYPDSQFNFPPNLPTFSTGLTASSPITHGAYTYGGRRLLMVAYSADEVVVVDPTTRHPSTQFHFVLSGHNPIGIVTTPDSKKAFVAYRNSPFISILDTSHYGADALPQPTYIPYAYNDDPKYLRRAGFLTRKRLQRFIGSVPLKPGIQEVGAVALVDRDPWSPEIRRGKILFDSANPEKHPTLSGTRQGSCVGCHADGANDGSVWSTMEGERRTMSLRGGVKGRGWLHSSGTHREVSEFATTIVPERLGGNLSEDDAHALSKYVAVGIPRLQPPKTIAALAERGRSLFQEHCVSCHSGPALTSGRPIISDDPLAGGDPSGPALYDIGTATTNAGVGTPLLFERLRQDLPEAPYLKLIRGDRDLGDSDPVQRYLDFRPRPNRSRGSFIATSLINVWDNTLFFHDGRFSDLSEVVDYFDSFLGLQLPQDDKTALIEYLRTL